MKTIFILAALCTGPSAWGKLSCSSVVRNMFSKSTHHLVVDLTGRLAVHTVTSCSETRAGERCSAPQVAAYHMSPLEEDQWSLAPLIDSETSDHLSLTVKKHSPHSRVCYIQYGLPNGCFYHKLKLENEVETIMNCSTDVESEKT